MQLYRLTLATIIQRKVWVVALLWMILVPLVMPLIMTYSNPSLVQPARAQAAWASLWGIAMTWVFFQTARFGAETTRSGIGCYFLSTGISPIKQLLQIWAACLSFLVPLLMVAIAFCLLGAMPSDPNQAGMWFTLNIQYALLFFLVVAPLMLLAIALGSRLGDTVGYVVPLALLIYGLYGVGYLSKMADKKNGAVLNWLYVFSPHYHLADLTPRLVFKMGSMLWAEYFQVAAYLAGMGIVMVVFSVLYYRSKPSA